MNILQYVQANKHKLTGRKKKQLLRKIDQKLRNLQPRILEARLMNLSANNKVFKYQKRLTMTRDELNGE